MIKITWTGCGPDMHPAFSSAVEIEAPTVRPITGARVGGRYEMTPHKSVTGKKRQRAWANDKLAHLRSWGIQGRIVIVEE